jgi:two-component system sensor histidine kinase CpxA
LIIFLGSLWLYRSIATPLKILHEASSKLSVGDFSVRTKPAIGSRKDELGQLACAFDQMAIKIEALLTNQKQLFRDISHEIRTPLTRQKLALELAKDSPNPLEYLTQIERQNSHIDTLVNNLLTFMRLEDTPITEYETVDLNNMLDDLINEAELDAQSKKLDIKKQLEQNSLVQCNYILLLRAFENILMNAIKYSPDGSQILVKTWRTNGKVCASISDQGFGIPEEDLENILKPFYRADQSRNQQSGGYGLGLAITEKIIKQHHGSLIIKNLTPHGLEVTIELDAIE